MWLSSVPAVRSLVFAPDRKLTHSALLRSDGLHLLNLRGLKTACRSGLEFALGLDDDWDWHASLVVRPLLGQQSLVVALLLVDLLHHALSILLVSVEANPFNSVRVEALAR